MATRKPRSPGTRSKARTPRRAPAKRTRTPARTKTKPDPADLPHYMLVVRWIGDEPNPAFCDGWATITAWGWSAGLAEPDDEDVLFREDELDDAVAEFLSTYGPEYAELTPRQRERADLPWDFGMVSRY